MISAAFAEEWKSVSEAALTKFELSSPMADGLSAASAAALKEIGLPEVVAAWLEFDETDDYLESVVAVLEEKNMFPIGNIGFSALICIDKNTDKVVRFDTDYPDESEIINSSLKELYESMLLFQSFVAEVKKRNPNYIEDYKIPDGMLGELSEKLTACDPEAMREKGYWYCQVAALDDESSESLKEFVFD